MHFVICLIYFIEYNLFSLENIEIIQNAIRAKYMKTNKKYIIDKQDYDQLKIIMRPISLCKPHQDNNIKEQVTALNNEVLDFCNPKYIVN